MWIEQDGTAWMWFLDERLDLPAPLGLEWMTPEQLDGYYLLYPPPADAPAAGPPQPATTPTAPEPGQPDR